MGEEVNLLDYGRVVWKWRKFIAGFTCLVLFFTVLVYSVMPWTYTAETTIIIPQREKGFDPITALTSNSYMNLPTDIFQSSFGRTKNFSDILKSYSLAREVVDGLKLYNEYPRIKDRESLVKKIMKSIKVKDGKNMIRIYVSSKSPKLAASIANYYILALDNFNKKGNFMVARRISEFLRQKIAEAKIDITEAEEKLKKFETETQLVKISDKELKLSTLMRDAEVKEAVYSMLMQEYEKSRIDEVKEELFFEILDTARPPKYPSNPRVLLYPILAISMGLFVGGFLSFFFEHLEDLGVKLALPDLDMKVRFDVWKKS